MILNENYFDEIEITDNDIESSDSDDIDYANPTEYYDAMTSKYTHCMIFEISMNNVLIHPDKWTVDIPCMFKHFLYLLDLYEIEHSQPTVVEATASIHLKNKFKNCKFFDFYGYKLITDCNSLEEFSIFCSKTVINMVLFFNVPEVHSYITACKLVGNMMKCLWKDEDHNRYLIQIMIYDNNFTRNVSKVNIHKPHAFLNKIDKSAISPDRIVVDILNLFFPEKTKGMILNELNNDMQLQLKLYQCFPD